MKDAVNAAILDTMPAFHVTPFLEMLLARQDLTAEGAAEVMEAIIFGRVNAASIGALMIALRMKGETVTEIASFAKMMRTHSRHVKAPPGALDTCGTGGDQCSTFNISTTTAFVAAGMGIPVAKHGGRAVTSRSGSPDVLKALKVNIEIPVERVEKCLAQLGICFMFAPTHHPGMAHVAPVRKELGVRSIFNLLGPLSNPALTQHQLLGVFDPSLCQVFAEVLHALGSASAMIVCGTGPGGKGHLDEISTFGPTRIARLESGKITIVDFDAAKMGFAVPPPDALHAHSCEHSAQIVKNVLSGDHGSARDIVVLNAAAAAVVAGKAATWTDGIKLAEKSIDDGSALKMLNALILATK